MSIKYIYPVVLVAATAVPFEAQSAGFQVSEHSASGLGRAFAGEAVITENASVLARNPAAMSQFDKASLSSAISLVAPDIDIEAPGAPYGMQKALNTAPAQVVPAAYFIKPVNETVAFGIAMFSGYGVTTSYPDEFYAGVSTGKTSLLTVNVNPSISYRINDSLSLGAGVSVLYAKAELDRHYGSAAELVPSAKPSDKTIAMKGDTYSWGWNIGMLYKLDSKNDFAMTFRSQVDLDFDGDFTDYTGRILTGTDKRTVKGQLPVVLPATIEMSGNHQFTDDFSLQFSALWTQWSKFKELRAKNSACHDDVTQGVCLLKNEDFKDNMRYSLGATYQRSEKVIVRAGIAFDEQAGKPTLSIPDTDRYWYSIGGTYLVSDTLSFDLGFSYIDGKKKQFTEGDEKQQTFISSTSAYIGAAQVNYSF